MTIFLHYFDIWYFVNIEVHLNLEMYKRIDDNCKIKQNVSQ